MPDIEAFVIDGIKMWFWSDDHDPPHFHAKKSGGEWAVRVFFLLDPAEMIEVISKKGPSGKVLKQLRTLAEEHRVALLEQCERNRGH